MSMQAVVEHKTTVDITSIYAMRYSGATLRQIADRIGRTKERVRQILIENYGSTKHKLVSTTQLCRLSGISWDRAMKLYHKRVITPLGEWDTGTGHRFLWSQTALKKIELYSDTEIRALCRICHCPVPKDRRCYCSEQCYKESQKYKYRSLKARQKHLRNMKRVKSHAGI